jgi:DNA-binding GntR family transcriptional regulator
VELSTDIKDETALEQAYRQLRSMILSREITLEEHLVEVTLAHELGLSRTPVREALRRLESEGLVKHQQGKGWRLAFLNKDDLREIFELKILLESTAAESAASFASDDVRHELLDISRKMLLAAEAGESEAWLALDRKFHTVLLGSANNKRLTQTVNNLNGQWWRVQVGVMAMTKRMAESAQEHQLIASAIADGDPDRAGCSIREHLAKVRDSVQQSLDVAFAFVERVR